MASLTFHLAQHYVDYFQQPAVLVTAFIIFGGIFLIWFEDYKLGTLRRKPERIPGCYRLGLYNGSNLDDREHRRPRRISSIGGPLVTGDATIKALFTYPLKSCKGVELKASEVLATGLKYDRLFSFAQRKPFGYTHAANGEADDVNDDNEWRFITQREFPRLALLKTELWVPSPRREQKSSSNGKTDGKSGARSRAGRTNATSKQHSSNAKDTTTPTKDYENDWALNGGCLLVRFPFDGGRNILGLKSTETVILRLPLTPTSQRAESRRYTSERMVIWKDRPLAVNMTNEIDPETLSKLSHFLGLRHPLALFRVDERHSRQVVRSLPKDRPNSLFPLTFADAFPVNILNIASVKAVSDKVPADSSITTPLDVRRFRANIYVSGAPAYAEETWKRVNIGRCIQPRSIAKRDYSPAKSARGNGSGGGGAGQYVETDGEYHVACRTARCKLVNVDPEDSERDTNEPDETLRKFRDVDPGASPHPVLGMQIIPLFPQGVLRVGDEVEVLERGEHVYEKMYK